MLVANLRTGHAGVSTERGIAEYNGDELATALDQLSKKLEKLLTSGSSNTYNAEVLRSLARRFSPTH